MSEPEDVVPYAPRQVPRPVCPAVVRRGAEADLAAAAALSLLVDQGTVEQWHTRLGRDVAQPRRALVVAEVEGELVGYARLGHVVPGPTDTAPEGTYLTGLVVAPAWRRCGVGAALVLEACAVAAQQAEVLWSYYDEDNLAAADLHAALGFRVVWRGDIGFPGLPPGSRNVLVQRLLGGS